MLKFFRIPFATSGDKTAVPDAVDVNGFVSYTAGYGFDYQRQKTDPAAKNIERDKMNEIFFDITTALAELQSQGIPDFITSALNGGSAYSYGQYAVVRYSGDIYVSLAGTNTATPADATKWALLPVPSRLQAALYTQATAGGTADALTGAFSPAIASLPAAPGTLSVMVRAGSANATTTPTFAADATAAKAIVKGANAALAVGDIAGAGHWLHLDFDPTLDKWVLLNPATGITPTFSISSTAQAQAQTNNTTVLTPLRLKEAAQGSNQSLISSGYQKIPGGLVIQWGSASVNANSSLVVTLPVAMTAGLQAAVTKNHNAADNNDVSFHTLTATQISLFNGTGGTRTLCYIVVGAM